MPILETPNPALLAESNAALTQDVADLKKRVADLERQIAKLNVHTHTLETTPSQSTGMVNLASVKNYVRDVAGFEGYANLLVLIRSETDPPREPTQYQSPPPTGITP